MAQLEGQEGDKAAVGAPVIRASDVLTRDDRTSPDQIKANNATDSAVLVQKGSIPAMDTIASDDVPPQKGMGAASSEKHLYDVLPSVDLQMIRDERKAGGTDTNFTYSMDSRTVKDASGGLSEADRETSIFYKIESGQVDGSTIFKNASELFKTSSTDGRPAEVVPRQKVTRDGQVVPTGDRVPGQPRTDDEPQVKPGEVIKPGEVPKPGEIPKPGDQQPPPYKFERLQMNEDGSAKVPVKNGDTVWGIARETLRNGKEPGYKPSDREVYDAVQRLKKENPQIKNIDRIQQGRDTIKIPKDMIKEIPPQVAPMDGPKVVVENRGATPEFQAKMQKEVDQLPAGVRRLLDANGTKIVVGDKMSGVYPELAGVQPRGWPPGSTWDNTDGMYSPSDKTTVITEHRVDDGKTVKNERAEGVVKHEVGHAVDHAMGNFSQSDEFKAAYDKDVAALSPADRAKVAYLLQPGNAGKSEAFAEVFGAVHGSSANPSETADTLRQFPALAELLRRKIGAM